MTKKQDEHILTLESRIEALKQEKSEQQKQLVLLKKRAAFVEALIDEIKKTVVPLESLPAIYVPEKKGKHIEDVVMHLSDEHMDEIVEPHRVQQLEDYNFPIACARAETYVNKVIDITQNTLSNYKFENLWIFANGDHTSGEIHGAVSRSYYRNQFRNCYAIAQVHALMIRDLAPYFRKVNVIYTSGNHGRRDKKKDHNGAWNNWDYAIGQCAMLLCKDISNVNFLVPDAYSVRLTIRNHVFHVEHGDDIPMWNQIPFYGMERKGRRLVALNASKNIHVHYFCYGHFHKPSTLGDLDGETIINGSWKATDAYVLGAHSGFTEPSQWIHGVHDKQGITWRFKIYLRSPNEKQGPKRYQVQLSR
jgi:hypothetical protein